MKGLHKLVFALSIMLVAVSCGKKNVPQSSYFFTFKVRISKKITEPTIVNGYYGQMNQYKNNTSSKTDSLSIVNGNRQTVNYSILLFETNKKDIIESVSYTKDGLKFYDLKKLKKEDVKPKFIIIPNKKGFYQVDNNDKAYHVLIRINKKTGYYPGGLGTFEKLNNELKQLEMKVDLRGR